MQLHRCAGHWRPSAFSSEAASSILLPMRRCRPLHRQCCSALSKHTQVRMQGCSAARPQCIGKEGRTCTSKVKMSDSWCTWHTASTPSVAAVVKEVQAKLPPDTTIWHDHYAFRTFGVRPAAHSNHSCHCCHLATQVSHPADTLLCPAHSVHPAIA